MSAPGQAPPCATPVAVPLDRVAGFVRLLSHALRNSLNVIDLEATYAAQLIGDEQAIGELQTIRALVRGEAALLQRVSSHLNPLEPSLVTCLASVILADAREQLALAFLDAAAGVQWSDASGAAEIAVDLPLFRGALREIFDNAFQTAECGGTIAASAFVGEGCWVLEIRETKTSVALSPEIWGVEPFVTSRRGSYGLGLFQVRRVVAAHDGEVSFTHDSVRAELITRIALPLVR